MKKQPKSAAAKEAMAQVKQLCNKLPGADIQASYLTPKSLHVRFLALNKVIAHYYPRKGSLWWGERPTQLDDKKLASVAEAFAYVFGTYDVKGSPDQMDYGLYERE